MFARLLQLPVNAMLITGQANGPRCRALIELGSWSLLLSVLAIVASGVVAVWYVGG